MRALSVAVSSGSVGCTSAVRAEQGVGAARRSSCPRNGFNRRPHSGRAAENTKGQAMSTVPAKECRCKFHEAGTCFPSTAPNRGPNSRIGSSSSVFGRQSRPGAMLTGACGSSTAAPDGRSPPSSASTHRPTSSRARRAKCSISSSTGISPAVTSPARSRLPSGSKLPNSAEAYRNPGGASGRPRKDPRWLSEAAAWPRLRRSPKLLA